MAVFSDGASTSYATAFLGCSNGTFHDAPTVLPPATTRSIFPICLRHGKPQQTVSRSNENRRVPIPRAKISTAATSGIRVVHMAGTVRSTSMRRILPNHSGILGSILRVAVSRRLLPDVEKSIRPERDHPPLWLR